jgi:hypothetical protein
MLSANRSFSRQIHVHCRYKTLRAATKAYTDFAENQPDIHAQSMFAGHPNNTAEAFQMAQMGLPFDPEMDAWANEQLAAPNPARYEMYKVGYVLPKSSHSHLLTNLFIHL